MDWKTIEKVAENTDKKWLLNQGEVAKLMGCSRQLAASFLVEQSVPFYRIGKEKKYFLFELIEAIEKTRYAS